MVWFVTLLLQALLLDELWTSTCLAKTVGLCQSASFHPTFQYVNLQLSGSCTGCFHLTGNKKIQQTSNAGGGLGVARGQLREIALLQHRQPPPTGPPSPDSTDPNISAFSNVTFTSSISSTVRTTGRRKIMKTSDPSFKQPPLPFTPSFWEWVAPSTTITHWSLLWSWVLILREFCFQASSSFCQLRCQIFPFKTCPFQHC